MHLKILSKEQQELLPLIAKFKREYYLVGGTAIALHLGHRESIDFDLFKFSRLRKSDIRKKISTYNYQLLFEDFEQMHFIINHVKCTFFSFPYKIPTDSELKGIIKMPDLLTLASMKAFALGRRAKWKDYVDLYFLLKYHFTVDEISAKSSEIFKEMFSERQFKMQLGFFKGISYEEEVHYLVPNPPSDDEVKVFLENVSIEGM